MRSENNDRRFTLIGRLMAPENHEPKYKVKRDTVVSTCADPQIWEMVCEDGTVLYARFANEELTCKEKRTGQYICSGRPALDKTKIPDNKLEFYLEMYSQHNIYFQ
jgi:hypothetical protein